MYKWVVELYQILQMFVQVYDKLYFKEHLFVCLCYHTLLCNVEGYVHTSMIGNWQIWIKVRLLSMNIDRRPAVVAWWVYALNSSPMREDVTQQ